MDVSFSAQSSGMPPMSRAYEDRFFDWVNLTASRSARVVLPAVRNCVTAHSVVDVGCGQGAWLSIWKELGAEIFGLDGDYVARDRLLIAPEQFLAVDLERGYALDRRFDLAQSLEVAEHLRPATAGAFVAGLCALSDVVLFSAAQPGQGGEVHLNERTPSYWAGVFSGQGYEAYDAVRPLLAECRSVAPWYRYNTVLYANRAGRDRLSPTALGTRCDDLRQLDTAGDIGWRLRLLLLRPLPEPIVTQLSRARYRVACALERSAKAA